VKELVAGPEKGKLGGERDNIESSDDGSK